MLWKADTTEPVEQSTSVPDTVGSFPGGGYTDDLAPESWPGMKEIVIPDPEGPGKGDESSSMPWWPYLIGVVVLLIVIAVIYYCWSKQKSSRGATDEIPAGELSDVPEPPIMPQVPDTSQVMSGGSNMRSVRSSTFSNRPSASNVSAPRSNSLGKGRTKFSKMKPTGHSSKKRSGGGSMSSAHSAAQQVDSTAKRIGKILTVSRSRPSRSSGKRR